MIFLWYDYGEDIKGEYWLKIEANTHQLLSNYLSNKIGIKELIDNATIFLCTRLYEKYFELRQKEKLQNFDNINLPENVYLGYDFLKKLQDESLTRITYSNSFIELPDKHKSNSFKYIKTDVQTIKTKNVNKVASDDYYYLIAASEY